MITLKIPPILKYNDDSISAYTYISRCKIIRANGKFIIKYTLKDLYNVY